MNRPTRHQRGAVAIIVALSIGVLVAMVGLAIDLGRMFVIKTELQNAADACALAAARELNGGADAITRADAAGILTGQLNLINFQDEPPTITAENITYSTALSPNNAYSRSVSPTLAEYVMCSLSRPNIGMLFMAVRGLGFSGFGPQTVSAYAVATLAPGQTTCAIPIAMCQQSSGSDPYAGAVIGQWYGGKFDTHGPSPCVTPGGSLGTSGNFNWVDFSPLPGQDPDCGNSNGAPELKCLIEGLGICELPPIGTLVGQQGLDNSLKAAWNTRFGIYGLGYKTEDAVTFPPDFTGTAYTNSNFSGSVPSGKTQTWPTTNASDPPNAYAGTPGIGANARNYDDASEDRDPYQNGNPSDAHGTPLPRTGSNSHTENGQSRRIAVAPIINCQSLCTPGTKTVPVKGYACIMMLSPMPNIPDNIYLEYLGPANDPNSPCGSYGLAGGSGPLIPVLVQ